MDILIIGETHDDISYIQNKMKITSVETIALNTDVFTGVYNNINIILTCTGVGTYNSSLITGIVLEKYKPFCCINIGTVHSFDESLNQCDIFIGTRVYLGSVDYTPFGRLTYGQIPDSKPFFTSDQLLVSKIKDINASLGGKKILRGVVVTDDICRTKREEVDSLIDNHYVKIENLVATDFSSGAVAFACSKFGVPYLSLKVCNYEYEKRNQFITRIRKGLSIQPYVGKLIAALIERN